MASVAPAAKAVADLDAASASGAAESGGRAVRFGVAVKMSTLGAGAEGAVGLSRKWSLRAGGNFFSYSASFTNDGIKYPAALTLRSVQATADWFPFGGSFHLSPGLLYNGNNMTANPLVATGQTFTLGGTSYVSGSSSVSGTAKMSVNPADPVFLVGWGNLANPRKHVIFLVEGGVAYHGTPSFSLGLNGTVCDPTGLHCGAISSNATVQADLLAQQVKVQNQVSPYKVYPVMAFGFGYRF